MGTVYKKTYTKPLPAGAKIIVRKGERLAEWKGATGKTRTAPVAAGKDGTDRIRLLGKTFFALYRDGSNLVREVPTGCKDESAARAMLTELEKRADKVRSGIRTGAEDAAVDHHATPLAEHFAAFLDHQKAKGVSRRVNDTRSQLQRVAKDCNFRRLAELDAGALERWLLTRQDEGMSAATRNEYRGAWVLFCNWCLRTGRLLHNPFEHVPRADAKADPRRKRRALTEDELRRLLYVGQWRPLAEYGRATVRKDPSEVKRKRDTWKRAPLVLADLDQTTARARERLAKNPGLVAELERLGRERALIYKTLVLTGLRRGELASITVGQLDLDTEPAFLVLDAADEKNRQGNSVAIRADLAADIRAWLAEKAAALQGAASDAPTVRFDPNASRAAEREPGDAGAFHGLPADSPVFNVPRGLLRILERDMKAAGIPKRDGRGMTVDVHAMRKTFGTLLSKAGVPLVTTQHAMRHSDPSLTAGVYTDPKLLDIAGAVESLPSLPLGSEAGQFHKAAVAAKATGTDDWRASALAAPLAVTSGQPGTNQGFPVNSAPQAFAPDAQVEKGASASAATKKGSPTGFIGEPCRWAMADSNGRHPRCKRGALTN